MLVEAILFLAIKLQPDLLYLLAYKTGIFSQDFGLKLGDPSIGEVYRE